MADQKKKDVKKGFFARMFESLDKKLQESSQSCGGCCCGPKSDDPKDRKCC
jgi:hypothetical protein